MANVTGRAGFHATHAKSAGERVPAVDEMMRSLDPERSEFWASINPSIVLADEHLNVELVNDGAGNMVPCTDRAQVIAYGQQRIARLHRALTPDHLDKNGKKVGGTVTTSLLVAHLPKSMCVEVPGAYPRFRRDGSPMLDANGEHMFRSRWVPRDRDEALRYFADVRAFLCENVVPGGHDALLGESDQFSESTPHAQFMFDTFADHPDKPGKLRSEASQAWFSHRDVKDDKGRVKSGKAKMRDYHAQLKAFLIAKGYPISPDFDEEAHMTGFEKDMFGELEDLKAEVAEADKRAQLDIANAALMAAEAAQTRDQTKAANYLANDARKDAKLYLDAAKRDAATIRSEAHETGRSEGYERGRSEGLASVAAVAAEWAEADTAGHGEGPSHRRARQAAEAAGRAAAEADRRAATSDRQKAAEARARDEQAERAHNVARDAELSRLRAEEPDVTWWLDKPRKNGRAYREIYDHEVAARRRTRAQFEAKAEELERKVTHDDDQLGR
ncbi:hypothetical protein [Acidipropionibacterium timonense]|uniref:hypothetical protein n=1 Tax=Acidipropionibacterium timonense TaxID=2161818 RepID=UPI001032271D|nr:hypothetical protein [Acidipropionibacterium timonense]